MARAALRLFIGVIFAAILAGGVYLIAGAPDFSQAAQLLSGRHKIVPGFVGMADFGRWRLICASEPAAAQAPKPIVPNAKIVDVPPPELATTCRINQEVGVKNQPEQVILAANLSIVGAQRRPALMLRLPPTAHVGDVIVFRFGTRRGLYTKVRDCTPAQCIAASELSDDEWNDFLAADSLRVAIPSLDGQRVWIDLSIDGLGAAVAAMNVAQRVS